MYLSELKIKGYKIFNDNNDDEFKIKFNKGLTVLIGENGCGKSAIIDTIRLLLNEDEFGRIGISDNHFYKPITKAASEPGAACIEVNGIFSGLTDGQQVAYLPWLDATENTKAYLNKKIDNKENFRGKYDHTTWGGESISSIFEWELVNAISCIYLPPLRDAESKLEAYRGSRLSRLFKKEKPKKGDPKHELETQFEKFNAELLKQPVISKVNEDIKKYLKESLGVVLGQDAMIQFSEASFDRIVERLRLLFYPNISSGTKPEHFRDISENSLGYNNILYLATVLAELEGLEHNRTQHKILLIEEPEAHLHPQLQIKLLKYLHEQSTKSDIQIIITTHSSTITSSCGLASLNVLSLRGGKNPKSTLISECGLNKEDAFFLERWLDITKSTLFFAKGVLFVEGIAEALVIKELAKRVIKKHVKQENDSPNCLEDYGVSIINLNGIYFKHFMRLFQGYTLDKAGAVIPGLDFIPIKCAGITDCDPQKVEETKPTLSAPCNCGNTHSKQYADELIENNSPTCKIFYNLKTFEYDLGLVGNNLQTLYNIIFEEYKISTTVSQAIEVKSKTDWLAASITETVKAEECFLLLKEIASMKGEFAQKLALKLSENESLSFEIPKYIEDAIIWVTGIKTATTTNV